MTPRSLYDRYMAADREYRAHAATCTGCTEQSRCATGEPLFQLFARLQDAYLAGQRKR
ncbi:hypothetical protein [Streptomyces antarcticus]|uniref:hypothetical protein n=1 Tax=Streptomyces antarcticus TaxID=2996458 RepID=UPI00226F1138|nr:MULTISPECIES: hypothetical protein [unclassified Streptomyces]MCY0946988.1 hypothetical protein [Streptomyces sp. H34-AA3]MCZ4088459.1 hypothetical protein [Streptomyces sp. H34-S5]